MKRKIELHNKYKVQIIAPSGKVSNAAESEKLLLNAIELLESYEFTVKKPVEHLFEDGVGFYASSLENRIKQLEDALSDPSVDIIWAFRGGYGALEVALRSMHLKPSKPQIIIGFSDITALHGLFNWHYKIPSIHASVLTSLLGHQAHHMNDILNMLQNKTQVLPLECIAGDKEAVINAHITGGNLRVLTSMIGTDLHPQTKGKIVLLEEVNEHGYRVIRDLKQMEEAGLFQSVAAIILGDFILESESEMLEFALREFRETFTKKHPGIPIFTLKGTGHGANNIPIVLGDDVSISGSKLYMNLLGPIEHTNTNKVSILGECSPLPPWPEDISELPLELL